MILPPSIFNDVLGPVMRGPSSSHSAAANRIARIAGNYQHLIPFDEVVVAMNKVAHQIPRELRCTNLGGLSITPTAAKIAAKLAAKSCGCQSSCKL